MHRNIEEPPDLYDIAAERDRIARAFGGEVPWDDHYRLAELVEKRLKWQAEHDTM